MVHNLALYVECYKEYCSRCVHNTCSEDEKTNLLYNIVDDIMPNDLPPQCKKCGECINNLFDPNVMEMTNFEEVK